MIFVSPGRFGVALTSRCTNGSFAASLKYGEELIGETVVRAAEVGSTTYLMIEYPAELDGVMIRNELDPSSLVQLDSIALMREPG